jgi:hypothetical protein
MLNASLPHRPEPEQCHVDRCGPRAAHEVENQSNPTAAEIQESSPMVMQQTNPAHHPVATVPPSKAQQKARSVGGAGAPRRPGRNEVGENAEGTRQPQKCSRIGRSRRRKPAIKENLSRCIRGCACQHPSGRSGTGSRARRCRVVRRDRLAGRQRGGPIRGWQGPMRIASCRSRAVRGAAGACCCSLR